MGENVNQLRWRESIGVQDREQFQRLLESSTFFSPQECKMGLSLVDDYIGRNGESDYRFVLAEGAEGLVGFSCYGEIEATDSRFDLYWIVVDHKLRGQGVGKLLLQQTEHKIQALGGKMIFVDTSGRDQYLPTRLFYEHNDYIQAALVKDFYAQGDHKVIYAKRLCS